MFLFFSSFLTNFDFLPPPHHHHPMLYILYTKTKKLLYVFPFFFLFWNLKFFFLHSSMTNDDFVCVYFWRGDTFWRVFFFFCLLTTTNCTKVSRNQIFFFKFPQNPECVFSKYEKHELTILKETHTCTQTHGEIEQNGHREILSKEHFFFEVRQKFPFYFSRIFEKRKKKILFSTFFWVRSNAASHVPDLLLLL